MRNAEFSATAYRIIGSPEVCKKSFEDSDN